MINEERLIALAEHCIGLDYKNPYTRHGKKFYRPYRNYYGTVPDDEAWNHLQQRGFADHDEPNWSGTCTFWLTRAGLDWLGQKLGIIIYSEKE